MAKKAESTLFNMLLSLTLIALVASLALALVNNATKGPIEEVNKAKVAEAIKKVLPEGKKYTVSADTVTVKMAKGDANLVRYTATDDDGTLVGKAIESFDDNGFGGRLTAMVGFDAEGNISGYEILGSSETPGLGAKADKWFKPTKVDNDGNMVNDLESGRNVLGKNPSINKISVKKDGGEIDAITGSTITSRAFCRLVETAYIAFNTDTEKGDKEQ